jgi:peptidoglycan/xylan/chitin deacetylase (PgdA/CDA1 family)
MKIPILTYHSLEISGADYSNNAHVALEHDLPLITSLGFEIRPLHELVKLWLSNPAELKDRRVLALTCDDGSDFDYFDIDHQIWGKQTSFLNILKNYQSHSSSAQPGLFITSYVIVSDSARRILDNTCLIGKSWWNSSWWFDAIESGLMGIANHSWDHNHISLPVDWMPPADRGTFTAISTPYLADAEIRRASELLWRFVPNPAARVFAYPYGDHPDFLVDKYFPENAVSLQLDAAVIGGARPWTENCNRWKIPRYVHPADWSQPDDLKRILLDTA